MEKKTMDREKAAVEETVEVVPAVRVRYENLPIVVIAGRPNVARASCPHS